MANVLPISPDEVEQQKATDFPDEVFEAFNELIVQKFTSGCAIFARTDVLELIVKKGLDREVIFVEQSWLNLLEAYRSAGWVVDCDNDKPVCNETYGVTFTFSKQQ